MIKKAPLEKGVIMFIGEILKAIFKSILSIVLIGIFAVILLVALMAIIGIIKTLVLFALTVLGLIVGALIYGIKKL